MPDQTLLPRWKGFNLLGLFSARRNQGFDEEDFQFVSEFGFDFLRIPISYPHLVVDKDPYRLSEAGIKEIDRILELGEKYSIHICLNLHRAPGYCVNDEYAEPYNLFTDEDALMAFSHLWKELAARYKGIESSRLSLNLINEPPNKGQHGFTPENHQRVVEHTVREIREVSPDRLIIIDGYCYGTQPFPELKDLGVAQSCRGYLPMGISHYKASWVKGENWPEPKWPGAMHGGEIWGREELVAHYESWAALAREGVGVHCGEAGAFSYTPHGVFLSWMEDLLSILKSHNIGIALWNLRGPFGVLESGRSDVEYDRWRGHQLDRKLLDLLMRY